MNQEKNLEPYQQSKPLLKNDLVGEYYSHFRDSFFVIDGQAKVLTKYLPLSAQSAEHYPKKIDDMRLLFPSIKELLKEHSLASHAASLLNGRGIFLENINLNIWGEAFPIHLPTKGEKKNDSDLYAIITYSDKAKSFLFDLLSEQPKEFLRHYIRENTKQSFVFLENIKNFLEILANHRQQYLRDHPQADILGDAMRYMHSQVQFFQSYCIQQNFHFETDDNRLNEDNALNLRYIFDEIVCNDDFYVHVEDETAYTNSWLPCNKGWVRYTLKNIIHFITNEFPDIKPIKVEIQRVRLRNQVLLKFDLNNASAEHFEIFYQTGRTKRSFYQMCRNLAEINQGNLRFVAEQKKLIFSLPLKPSHESNDNFVCIIADAKYQYREKIGDIFMGLYTKLKKVEVSNASDLIQAVTQVQFDCIVLDPFFTNDTSKKEIIDLIEQLFFCQVSHKPMIYIYAEHEKIKPLLPEIAVKYDLVYLRKEISKDEIKIMFNQAVHNIRNFKTMHALAQNARKASETDRLTGAYNRAFYEELIEKEIQRTQDSGTNLHMIITDIDYFKNYNDMNGHLAGDQLLRDFVRVLKDHVRSSDYVIRYGGEEFVILLLNAPTKSVAAIVEKIRSAIENYRFHLEHKQPTGNLTASFGVSSFPLDGTNADDLFHTADQRLYQAKRSGRNRVVYHT